MLSCHMSRMCIHRVLSLPGPKIPNSWNISDSRSLATFSTLRVNLPNLKTILIIIIMIMVFPFLPLPFRPQMQKRVQAAEWYFFISSFAISRTCRLQRIYSVFKMNVFSLLKNHEWLQCFLQVGSLPPTPFSFVLYRRFISTFSTYVNWTGEFFFPVLVLILVFVLVLVKTLATQKAGETEWTLHLWALCLDDNRLKRNTFTRLLPPCEHATTE